MRTSNMSDPAHTILSVVLENVAAIVTGATVILLALLGYLGKKDQSKIAKAVLTETPVSHAELISCRMETQDAMRAIIREEFKDLREEFIKETNLLHRRITEETKH